MVILSLKCEHVFGEQVLDGHAAFHFHSVRVFTDQYPPDVAVPETAATVMRIGVSLRELVMAPVSHAPTDYVRLKLIRLQEFLD